MLCSYGHWKDQVQKKKKILTEDTFRAEQEKCGVKPQNIKCLAKEICCSRIFATENFCLSLAVKKINAKQGSSLSFYIQLPETGNSRDASRPFRWDEILGLILPN